MRISRRVVCLGLLLAVAGCQSRLNVARSYKLDSGTIQTIDIEPPRYDQKVTVTVDTDAPVSVFVYLKKDQKAVERDLTLKQKSDKALGSWSGDKSGTIDVTVPTHEIAIVRIEAEKKAANVAVKIVGK